MQHLSLTVLDYVAIGIMLVSALYAMARGLVHETFSIIDWLFAGYAAGGAHLHPPGELLSPEDPDER